MWNVRFSQDEREVFSAPLLGLGLGTTRYQTEDRAQKVQTPFFQQSASDAIQSLKRPSLALANL